MSIPLVYGFLNGEMLMAFFMGESRSFLKMDFFFLFCLETVREVVEDLSVTESQHRQFVGSVDWKEEWNACIGCGCSSGSSTEKEM